MGIAIRLVRCITAGVALLLATTPVDAQTAKTEADSGRSVLSGVYTLEQATQGENVFKTTCLSCHTTSQFEGTDFQKQWAGRAVFSFFDKVRTEMPQDNPGGLSRAEYLGVMAYVFKLNGWPDGTSPLPDDDAALKQIRFITPPEPLH